MLPQDEDLRREDIQLLTSRDALAAFFARLGYDTNYRLGQSAAAMNLTGDALTTNIRHIERIASQDGGLFEVYLFELASVTVAGNSQLQKAKIHFLEMNGWVLKISGIEYLKPGVSIKAGSLLTSLGYWMTGSIDQNIILHQKDGQPVYDFLL